MQKYIETCRRVFELETKYILTLPQILNDDFAHAVDLIMQAKGRVVFSGVGKSGLVGKKIAATLSSVGKQSIFVHAAEASHGDLGTISKEDVVVMISNSGNTPELLDIINYCKDFEIPIIAIVGNIASVLYKAASGRILLPKFEEVALKIPSTSTTLTTMIGDAIAACVVEHYKVSSEQYRTYHPGGKIGKSFTTVSEIMRVGAAIPVVREKDLMSDVIITITSKAIGCAVVVDANMDIKGIITDGDLRRNMSASFTSMHACDIMTKSPKTISAEMLVSDAIEYMGMVKIMDVIVAENNKLVGIVHMHDCISKGYLS